MTTKHIKGYECRFGTHVPTRRLDERPDVTFVKEVIHYDDGTTKPNLRAIRNYKRPFYVTKKAKQNHTQKKETEELENLLAYSVTQSELRDAVAKALERPWSRESLKELSASPFLYGSDISSTALMKRQYQVKYPDLKTAYTVCTFDVETDVINGTELIIMATVCFQDKCFTAVVKDFVKGFANVQLLFNETINKYIKPYIDKHKMSPELYVANDAADLLKAVFGKVHEWMPDFLAIWNMNFDIPKVLAALQKYNIDPRDVLCDPSIPNEYRICRYKPGPNKKVTASGRVIPIKPSAQWHTLINTASFYVIDAMCVYKQIRLAKQEEPNYSLDAILNKELGIRKLHFTEADQYKGLKWHQVMQTMYKLEYMVYNIFDSLSMLELDAKTKDLCLTLPTYAAASDFCDFKSQPKKIADALHDFCLERGLVLGTVGAKKKDIPEEIDEDAVIEEGEEDEEDLKTLSLKDWISTLPSHMVVPGIACIEEDPTIKTNIRAMVYDSDAVSAYPTATSVANVSKATTKREIISIGNIEEEVFRLQNINSLTGHVNALEYCTLMFNFMKPTDMLKTLQ